jgi:hypothetical protein
VVGAPGGRRRCAGVGVFGQVALELAEELALELLAQ